MPCWRPWWTGWKRGFEKRGAYPTFLKTRPADQRTMCWRAFPESPFRRQNIRRVRFRPRAPVHACACWADGWAKGARNIHMMRMFRENLRNRFFAKHFRSRYKTCAVIKCGAIVGRSARGFRRSSGKIRGAGLQADLRCLGQGFLGSGIPGNAVARGDGRVDGAVQVIHHLRLVSLPY